jgi:hypothetical protein
MITHTESGSAYEEARALYEEHKIGSLDDDILNYSASREGYESYVFAAPDYLLIGCRVSDGWFIRLAVGRNCLQKFVELMPYYLPWIGWARLPIGRGEVRWYRTESVLRSVNKQLCTHK